MSEKAKNIQWEKKLNITLNKLYQKSEHVFLSLP